MASPRQGMSLQGSHDGARAKTLESQTKASRREDSASAIHHVPQAAGTIELNQSRGPFGSRAPLCPGLSQYLPQEGIQFRDFSGGPVVKNLPSSNPEDSIPG